MRIIKLILLTIILIIIALGLYPWVLIGAYLAFMIYPITYAILCTVLITTIIVNKSKKHISKHEDEK